MSTKIVITLFLSHILFLCASNNANAQYVSVYDANGKLKSVKQSQCSVLNEFVKKAFTFFSSDIGALLDTKTQELYNGVSTNISTYASALTLEGSRKSQILCYQIIKKGVVRDESILLQIYTYSYEFKTAEAEYIKLYNDINGCEITSPSGQTYTLRNDLSKPVLTVDGYMGPALVDFSQLVKNEKIYISLNIARDENGKYYSCISVSKFK
ncbi:MAG: hypothetical protein LH615_16030 [Ferruginibacter sp.]|nr:hypothetical protein [Ferruginibacter sp.]